MINPMTVGPISFRGGIWYQGESNVYAPNANRYGCKLGAMIMDWRKKFAVSSSEQMPFYVIQLAAYTQGISEAVALPSMRLYQAEVTAIPHVSLTTAIDTGDLASKYGNIHPMDKKTLGVRMAKGS
jgi:sialate O-acetylesterase